MLDQPSDQILRCLLPDPPVRVVAAITTRTAREAARRHGARDGVAVAMGRAATAATLLATLTKDVERLSLRLLGDGPLGAITVDVNSSGGVRAFVKRPGLRIPVPAAGDRLRLGDWVGREGLLGVVRDLGLREPIRGQTALRDGEIDTDVEGYLIESEQIDSALGCDALVGSNGELAISAGVLVQTLPEAHAGALLADARARLRAGLLTALLEIDDVGPVDLARAVLGEAGQTLKVLDRRGVEFLCPCSRERAAATLTLLGAKEVSSLREDDGGATVTCEFCKETYRFTEEDLAKLLAAAG
jgi:molecular chaperone Hsp33